MANTLFDKIKHIDAENKSEFWLARELMPLLEYTNWQNFHKIIEKAKIACQQSKNLIEMNFIEVSKIVETGISTKEILDYELTRYACYLIAMNGNSSKPVIAQAQSYFAEQTRKQEQAQEQNQESLDNRKKLRDKERVSYRDYDNALEQIDIKDSKVAILTSQGDKALFTKKTSVIKLEFGIKKKGEPLADYLHPVPLAGRTLARLMTGEALARDEIQSYEQAKKIHTGHNLKVREAMVESNMYPESFSKMERVSPPKKSTNSDENLLELQEMQAINTDQNNQQNDLFE